MRTIFTKLCFNVGPITDICTLCNITCGGFDLNFSAVLLDKVCSQRYNVCVWSVLSVDLKATRCFGFRWCQLLLIRNFGCAKIWPVWNLAVSIWIVEINSAISGNVINSIGTLHIRFLANAKRIVDFLGHLVQTVRNENRLFLGFYFFAKLHFGHSRRFP